MEYDETRGNLSIPSFFNAQYFITSRKLKLQNLENNIQSTIHRAIKKKYKVKSQKKEIRNKEKSQLAIRMIKRLGDALGYVNEEE